MQNANIQRMNIPGQQFLPYYPPQMNYMPQAMGSSNPAIYNVPLPNMIHRPIPPSYGEGSVKKRKVESGGWALEQRR